MGDFGSVHWKIFIKFLINQGCVFQKIQGDHHIYKKEGIKRPLVIPQYNPLPAFIVMNNLRTLGLKKKDLMHYLKRV